MGIKQLNGITTTAKLRASLAQAIEKVNDGELTGADAKSLIGLANQISTSMAVEVKVKEQQYRFTGKVSEFGMLEI